MPGRTRGRSAVEKKNQTLERLAIEYIPTDSVKANNWNPNRQNEHEFTLLCKSIEEDGFTQPIIVAQDYTIVDGEHRWRAAKHNGLSSIPVVVVPMEATQARIATLRHNRARGSEDIELATDILRDLEKLGALDWAADSLDLSDQEIQRLLDDIPAPDTLAAEEFSEAWQPSQVSTAPERPINDTGGTQSTPQALTFAREHEARMRAARDEEERQQIYRDHNIYRLTLSFAGDEADVVRKMLGRNPAQVVLTWCQEKAAAEQQAS